ncbi:hypothetical protein ACFQS2_12625 [Brachybacterium sp. GCM10030267]|uniref:hypothetical protein n=1 Tax=unclassified Brachybacterium TaxID=2623841 RepID=UPI00361D2B1F
MEDFDQERFEHGPGPLHGGLGRSAGAGRRLLSELGAAQRRDRDREETQVRVRGDRMALHVQALTPTGLESVRAEMQLLAALEVAGASAAPTVLEIGDEGYVRESARPLDLRGGRRSAVDGSPATAERMAQARAREDLDAVVDALHERGWALGAAPGQGIGIRADGSVVLLDLTGLAPGTEVSAQRADRAWVDSVLQDQERTLRRRIDEPRHEMPREETGPPPEDDPGEGAGTPPEEASGDDEVPAKGSAATRAAAPLPAPRLVRARTRYVGDTASRDIGGGGVTGSSWRTGARGLATAVRQVLAGRRTRRTAVLSAAVVLVAGTVLGVASWLILFPDSGPRTSAEGAGPAAAPASAEAAVPKIEDPWALATELAGTRHSYVTGISEEPAALEGSEALAEDDQVREAYEGVEVRGGGPVVHEAELVREPTADGTARLQIETSTAEHEVIEADGSTRTVPATEATVVDLDLRWDGSRWLVQRTRTVDDTDESP